MEDKPILTKFGKIVKVKNLDSFVQYGLADGSDIYSDKKQRLPPLAVGSEGWFDYHEARWTSGIKNIMDRFTSKQPEPIKKAEPAPVQPIAQNIQIQEIKNQDCLEISSSAGKADGRREQMIRIFGDFNKPEQMKAKLENAKKLIQEGGI